MPNTDNINTVIEALRQEQEYRATHDHSHFTMSDWAHLVGQSFVAEKERPTLCKTAACIAGTAVLVLEPDAAFQWHEDPTLPSGGWWVVNDDLEWGDRAEHLLDIDGNVGSSLFFRDQWPQELLIDHGHEYDDLAGAIFLLEEIRDGRLTMEGDDWAHPDLVEYEPENEDEDFDDELDEDADVDEAKLERHDRES